MNPPLEAIGLEKDVTKLDNDNDDYCAEATAAVASTPQQTQNQRLTNADGTDRGGERDQKGQKVRDCTIRMHIAISVVMVTMMAAFLVAMARMSGEVWLEGRVGVIVIVIAIAIAIAAHVSWMLFIITIPIPIPSILQQERRQPENGVQSLITLGLLGLMSTLPSWLFPCTFSPTQAIVLVLVLVLATAMLVIIMDRVRILWCWQGAMLLLITLLGDWSIALERQDPEEPWQCSVMVILGANAMIHVMITILIGIWRRQWRSNNNNSSSNNSSSSSGNTILANEAEKEAEQAMSIHVKLSSLVTNHVSSAILNPFLEIIDNISDHVSEATTREQWESAQKIQGKVSMLHLPLCNTMNLIDMLQGTFPVEIMPTDIEDFVTSELQYLCTPSIFTELTIDPAFPGKVHCAEDTIKLAIQNVLWEAVSCTDSYVSVTLDVSTGEEWEKKEEATTATSSPSSFLRLSYHSYLPPAEFRPSHSTIYQTTTPMLEAIMQAVQGWCGPVQTTETEVSRTLLIPYTHALGEDREEMNMNMNMNQQQQQQLNPSAPCETWLSQIQALDLQCRLSVSHRQLRSRLMAYCDRVGIPVLEKEEESPLKQPRPILYLADAAMDATARHPILQFGDNISQHWPLEMPLMFSSFLSQILTAIQACSIPACPRSLSRSECQMLIRQQALHVLVVDDVPVNIKMLVKILESNFGMICKAAPNGQAAFEAFMTAALTSQPFALIFMDIDMPVMNGFESTQHIRMWESCHKSDSDSVTAVTILGVSANTSFERRREMRNAGINRSLTKPIRAQQILSSLMEVVKF
jgi:CheY-like chemotaxis protein